MGFTRTELIVTCTVILLLVALILPAIQQAREAARRSQSKCHLKQIGLALHNYHDTFDVLPAGGMFNAEGRGMLGWMVSIAPYMDASPLYNQLELDQPWDSTRNAGVLIRRYGVYENPGIDTPVGDWEFPLAHYSANAHVMAANRWICLDEIESQAQVFLAAELAGDFTPWASPYNWRPLQTLNKEPLTYGRYSGDGAFFLLAGGHVEYVTNEGFEVRRESLAGPDLAEFQSRAGQFPRPAAFPVPLDSLVPTAVQLSGEYRWADAERNSAGQIVSLRTGRKAGSTWIKHGLADAMPEDISRIAGNHVLEELVLSGEFTSADLAPIRSLTKLRNLTLDSDQLTAEGLDLLTSLPQLQELTLTGTWVTADAIQQVQNLLPRCQVSTR